MTKNPEWLKNIRTTGGGMGDFIDPLATKAVRNAFDGLSQESALFAGLKQAVITTVRSANGNEPRILPSEALHSIVADLNRELDADNTAPLTPLAELYKAYTAERAANPPAPSGRYL